MSPNRHKCLHVLSAYVMVMLVAAITARKERDYKVPPNEYDEEGCLCVWTDWMNNNDYNPFVGDDTTYTNLRKSYVFCENPSKIKCRETLRWYVPFVFLHARNTICNVKTGLKCVSKPLIPHQRGESSYYCNDFEVTVLCCSCSTSTVATITSTTATDRTENEISQSTNSTEPAMVFSPELSRKLDTTEHNETALTVIILPIAGGIVFAALAIIIIYLIIRKYSASNKKAHLSFYQEVEAPNDEPTPLVVVDNHEFIPRSPPSGSSDYLTTSSEDEGYKSKPSYGNRKLKTKGQRNKDKRRRKRCSNVRRFENISDSSEFPIRDLPSSAHDNNDNGRFRRWFPDEYERALEQNIARNPGRKKQSIFIPPFQTKSPKEASSEEIV